MEYKSLVVSVPDGNEESLPKRRKTFATAFNRHREENRVGPSPGSPSPSPFSATDEYADWQKDRRDSDADVVDPFGYWHNKRSVYPRLAQMALDVLSAVPMSTEVERLFSATGQMVPPNRSRLEANTIGITQTVRSWLRAGYIDSEDMLINVPDDDEDAITIREARVASGKD